jgi:amino acid transporter
MFPMPRVVYSLASDGLIFKWLAILMPKLKTPVTAAVFSGLFAGKNKKNLKFQLILLIVIIFTTLKRFFLLYSI